MDQYGFEAPNSFLFLFARPYQKDENNDYFTITRKLDQYAMSESTPIDERIETSKKNLGIIKVYEEKMIGELKAKQEIVDALLASYSKILKETDFGAFGDEREDKKQAVVMKSKAREWLTLSIELLKSRKKATEAIQEGIDIDKMIPKFIIDNEGDLTKTMSSFEIKSKGDRLVRLTGEADEAENKIEEKRSEISINLFGNPEQYMDFGSRSDNAEKEVVNHNPLEVKAWFRFLKVVYIAAWILGLGFVILLSLELEEFGAFVIGGLIVWGIMMLIKKAFFYIALGSK